MLSTHLVSQECSIGSRSDLQLESVVVEQRSVPTGPDTL